MRTVSTMLLLGLLVVAVGWKSGATTRPSVHVASSELLSLLPPGCDVDCYQPVTCDECEHKAPFVGEDEGSHGIGTGDHMECLAGQCHLEIEEECELKHPICMDNGLPPTLELLEREQFDRAAVAITNGAGVEIDWDQGLISFANCAGKVLGTIALSSNELTHLALFQQTE